MTARVYACPDPADAPLPPTPAGWEWIGTSGPLAYLPDGTFVAEPGGGCLYAPVLPDPVSLAPIDLPEPVGGLLAGLVLLAVLRRRRPC